MPARLRLAVVHWRAATMIALSVRQPWPWAILFAGKNIENRSWKLPRNMIGRRVILHASAGCTLDEYESGAETIEIKSGLSVPSLLDLPKGAIVGAVTLTGCLEPLRGPEPRMRGWWATDRYGWQIEHAEQIHEPLPCKGRLGFWEVPEALARKIRRDYG